MFPTGVSEMCSLAVACGVTEFEKASKFLAGPSHAQVHAQHPHPIHAKILQRRLDVIQSVFAHLQEEAANSKAPSAAQAKAEAEAKKEEGGRGEGRGGGNEEVRERRAKSSSNVLSVHPVDCSEQPSPLSPSIYSFGVAGGLYFTRLFRRHAAHEQCVVMFFIFIVFCIIIFKFSSFCRGRVYTPQ